MSKRFGRFKGYGQVENLGSDGRTQEEDSLRQSNFYANLNIVLGDRIRNNGERLKAKLTGWATFLGEGVRWKKKFVVFIELKK